LQTFRDSWRASGSGSVLVPLTCALLLWVVGCSPPGQVGHPRSESSRLSYVLNKICIPVVKDHVSFETIVASEHLRKKVSCDIQECLTWYCTPGRESICFQPPGQGVCWTAISDQDDFARLSKEVLAVLNSDGRTWHEVKDARPEPGYKRAYCDQLGDVKVYMNGFLPGQVLGYLPGPLTDPSRRLRVTVNRTEFDVHVNSPKPGSCA
jgi:hypothetical protein